MPRATPSWLIAPRRVLAFETGLAAHHLRSEERRDTDLILNRHDLEQLVALSPGLDLPGYLTPWAQPMRAPSTSRAPAT